MSISRLHIVSEDFSHKKQGWKFVGIYRVGRSPLGGTAPVLRVEIYKDFYDFQSHAKVESWGENGWRYFSSLPIEEWYELLPSSSQKRLLPTDGDQFRFLRTELLSRYCAARWGSSDGIELQWMVRRSDYLEAQDDGAVAVGGHAPG